MPGACDVEGTAIAPVGVMAGWMQGEDGRLRVRRWLTRGWKLAGRGELALLRWTAAPCSYQPRLALTIFTTDSMTGTSISTPTTVASAAPDSKPNKLIAAATAISLVMAPEVAA